MGLINYNLAIRRISEALSCATHQEILDGMYFYDGAHGLCRVLSSLGAPSVRHAAGIYAALSPSMRWKQNVDSAFKLVTGDGAVGGINVQKANRILQGSDPDDVLSGRKVVSFYKSIADPRDGSLVPLDRHLIRLAVGGNHLSNDNYSLVEDAYLAVGLDHGGIGNRAASVAWFVSRRMSIGPTLPWGKKSSPVCCGKVMIRHGYSLGRRRWRCKVCGKVTVVNPTRSRNGKAFGSIYEVNGRNVIYLGRSDPYANKGGWQYLYRYNVMRSLGRRLRSDEHVDHVDNDKMNDDLCNLRVVLGGDHNSYHRGGELVVLARWIDGEGFVELGDEGYSRVGDGEVPF